MKAKGSPKALQTSNRELAQAAAQAQTASRSHEESNVDLQKAKKRYKAARKTLKQAKKAARKTRKQARKAQRKLESLLAKHAKLRKAAQKSASRKAAAKPNKTAKPDARKRRAIAAAQSSTPPTGPEQATLTAA